MTTIQTLIRKVKDLTPIPAVVHPLLEALNKPGTGMDEIAKIIQYDPAITAAVLRTTNSAFFGLKHPVESIKDATALLGVDQIVNLVLLKSGARMYKDSQAGYGLPDGDLWTYSVSSALIAKQIANELDMPDPAVIFTASLLKDMGKTLLGRFAKDAYDEISALVSRENISFMEAEKNVVGADHAELGALIARKWKFSPKMVKIIRYHHISDITAMEDINVAIVYLADCICMMMGMGDQADSNIYRFHTQALKRTGLLVDDVTRIITESTFKMQEVKDLLTVV